MIFDSLLAFIVMDGYGLYVWSAYGITLAVFAYNICASVTNEEGTYQGSEKNTAAGKSPCLQTTATGVLR